MSELRTSGLRKTLDNITPRIDHILSNGPLNDLEYMGSFRELPRDLKRRGGICNATSWLLSAELKKHNIYTTPYAKMGEIKVRGKSYMTFHVILKTWSGDGRYIDPTYQQFYRYVGLTPDIAAIYPEVATLYPKDNDIAIIELESTAFQEQFAENAHRIEKELGKMSIPVTCNPILKGTSLQEKIDTYKQVWDLSTYKSMFPPRFELRQAVFQSSQLLDRLT